MSTLNAITDKVHASGISKVALGPEEIRSIIQTLMYDGRVEEVRSVRLTSAVSCFWERGGWMMKTWTHRC